MKKRCKHPGCKKVAVYNLETIPKCKKHVCRCSYTPDKKQWFNGCLIHNKGAQN